MDKITEEKIKEEEEKKKLEKMTKREKEIYKTKNAGRLDSKTGLKRRRKTLQEQEREFHEAYQILLSEHNKKVRARAMQKISVVTALMKTTSVQNK